MKKRVSNNERKPASSKRLRATKKISRRSRAVSGSNIKRAKGQLDIDALMAAIIESSDDAIISKDLNGIIMSWNEGAERLFGYTAAEVVGKSVATLIPAGRADEESCILERIRRGEKVDHYETTRLRKDGHEIEISLTVSPVRDKSGKVIGASKIARDISSRRQAEERLKQALAREQEARGEAERANRVKDEFLCAVSHELRTPLTAINGWALMLRAGSLDAAQSARALETIVSSAKAQNQLINDLLDVSRIITGKMRLNVAPLNLGSVIEAAVETAHPAAEAKGIRLSVSLDPAADTMSGDAERLQQVVWNLLSNAVKFGPNGGRVEIRLKRVDSHVEIVVADNGQGIKPEFLPYVFERFRQEDAGTTRQHGGLGLGLAIVRHIIELHGGTVRAESEGLGKGATFTVSLPIARVPDAPPAESRDKAAGGRLTGANLPSVAGVRALVVEDDADARELIALILEKGGSEVRTAVSAAEALAYCDDWGPDILIADIGIPEEDGYTLMKNLRARESERGGHIPAIALTAYARREDRMAALSVGYEYHVPKPVDPAELLTVVAGLATKSNS
jgi:PAS domain S-box-containing protein